MNDIGILKLLCETTGVTGHEKGIATLIKSIFEKYCGEVAMDKFYNVTGVMKAKLHNGNVSLRDRPVRIMYTAHMDEIGMIVKKVLPKGFLKIGKISGVDPKTLISEKVVIHGNKGQIKGVVASIPPHLTNGEDKKKALMFDELYVDTGLHDVDLNELVCVGDIVSYAPSFETQGMNMVSGKSLDDRAGIFTLIRIMQMLKELSFSYDIFFHACVSEEFNSLGAKVGAYSIEPDVAVVIDMTHGKAGIAESGEEQTFTLGKGPVVCRSPLLDTNLTYALIDICKAHKLKPLIEVDNKDTGTDALAVSVVGCGCKTALLSIPLKYMHSQVEMLNLNDIELTAQVLVNFALINSANMEGYLCF